MISRDFSASLPSVAAVEMTWDAVVPSEAESRNLIEEIQVIMQT